MKKIKILSIIMIILLITACGKKEMTEDKFTTYFENQGFAVTDVTTKLNKDGVKKAVVAVKEDESYQIEYFIFEKENDAKVNFSLNKNKFIEEKSGTSAIKDESKTSYEKYALTNDGKYKLVARVKSSLIYVNTVDTYKKEINEMLAEIGY